MALGTLEPHAHEDLGDVLGQLESVEFALVVVHRGDGHRTAVGRKQFDDDLIDRAILADLIGHPVVVEQRVLVKRRDVIVTGDAGTNLEQFGPLHHPELSELLALQERLDEQLTFVGMFVRDEGLEFGRLGVESHDIDVDAADELLVGADTRGHDTQAVEALVDGLVDVVHFGHLRTLVDEALRDDDRLGGDTEDVKTREHEGSATITRLHDAVLTDGGDGVVVRHEEREIGHITVGTVRIGRPDGDLLGSGLTFEDDLLREDLDTRHLGDARGVVLGAIGDPLEDGLVVLGIGLVELVAGVRHGADGLLDHRAFLGDGEVDTAANHLTGEADVVTVRIHTKEGETETILTAGGAVAAAAIAGGAQEDRHDVLTERDRAIFLTVLDRDGDTGGESAERGDDFGLAGFSHGMDGVAVELGDLLISDLEVGEGGDVARGGVLEGGEDDEAMEVALGLEADGFGEDFELLKRREFLRELGLGFFLRLVLGGEHDTGGPDSAFGDPAADHIDLGGRQRAVLGRHDIVMLLRQSEALDEFALGDVDADESVATFSALEEGLAGGHEQLTLGLVRVVALQALALEDRAHFVEGDGGGGSERRQADGEQGEQRKAGTERHGWEISSWGLRFSGGAVRDEKGRQERRPPGQQPWRRTAWPPWRPAQVRLYGRRQGAGSTQSLCGAWRSPYRPGYQPGRTCSPPCRCAIFRRSRR